MPRQIQMITVKFDEDSGRTSHKEGEVSNNPTYKDLPAMATTYNTPLDIELMCTQLESGARVYVVNQAFPQGLYEPSCTCKGYTRIKARERQRRVKCKNNGRIIKQ